MKDLRNVRLRDAVKFRAAAPALLALALWLASAPAAASGGGAAQVSLAFAQKYADASLWYQYKAAAVTRTREVVMAVVASPPPGDPSKQHSVRLWALDAAGVRTSDTLIAPPAPPPGAPAPASLPEPDVTAVAALEGGDVLLVVEFRPFHPVLARVSRAGKQTLSQPILGPDRRPTFFKIIPTTDGKFILAGREAHNALALKVDEAGKVLWEKLEDRGRMDLFVDGVPTENGGALLVGNSGAYDMMRNGPSIIWVGRYGPTGALAKEVSLAGRYGSLASAPGGGFVVVYDKSSAAPQDIRAQMFGADWKRGWETKIVETEGGISGFQLAALPAGGFLVAGAKYGLAFVATLGADGALGNTFWGDKLDKAVVYDLVAGPGEYYVASSIYAKNELNRMVRQVRLLKFNGR